MEENQTDKFSRLLLPLIILVVLGVHIVILFATLWDYKMYAEEISLLESDIQLLSIQKFFHFILNDSVGKGVVLSFSIFIVLLFLLIITIFIVHHHKEANIKKAYQHGGRKQTAMIESINRTGITANDDSRVKLIIVFTHQNETIKKEVKMYVDILYPPQIGDTIQILYDPILDKVFLLKEEK